MLKSMTGFGAGKHKDEEHHITVEIKTLNSKFFDAQIKSPRALNSRELDIRNLVSDRLGRGKINLSIDFVRESLAEPSVKINEILFTKYYQNLKRLSEQVDDKGSDLVARVLEMPDVIIPHNDMDISEEEWGKIKSVLTKALEECDSFRTREGSELEEKILGYVGNIEESLEVIKSIKGERTEKIKSKLLQNLESIEKDNVDGNRFEQELIYYLEKLDITEEIVRLTAHLEHFRQTVENENNPGKKLGFISQEIGREINTIGSKSNYAPMQKAVVDMKDELEKIKEQTLNII